MLLFWGPEYVQLYNDAYIPTLGGPDRHPGALGRPAADWWAGDVWAFVRPALEAVVATGEATGADDQAVPLPRRDGSRMCGVVALRSMAGCRSGVRGPGLG
jgi:hypothetical protein